MRICVRVFIAFFLGILYSHGQVFPDCVDAVPICNNTPVNGNVDGGGIDDFNGSSSTGCITQANGRIESNAAWYHFRTGASGELGINIGFDTSEDWDFALYRTDDCSNLGEPVRCNYFDNSDDNSFTGFGEDPTGADNFQYDDWLQVGPGEDYYLMINNFSNANSGFSIQFSGNIFVAFPNTALDCSIVNNLLGPPVAACDADMVILDATTTGALSYEWYLDNGTGFQQIPAESGPTLTIAVSAIYRVLVVMPLGDNIISETQVAFSPSPLTNPLSVEWVCLDGMELDLSLKDIEALGSQSVNDFRVTYHTSVADAVNGENALSKNFEPNSSSQTIFVRTTSIENPQCFDASESFVINGVELPELDFPTEVYLCDGTPSATIGLSTANLDHDYSWDTGETSANITVTTAGEYTLSASNSDGTVDCIAVRTVSVVFSSPPEIVNMDIEYMGDDNTVTPLLRENGLYEYQLDDDTPQQSPVFVNVLPGEHTITVTDLNGCGFDTDKIVIVGFPKYFTPNGDLTNELWYVKGLSVLEEPIVFVYDRFGKLLIELRSDSEGWDGTYEGQPLPAADYWFKLTYTDVNGQTITAKHINSHFSLKR